MDTVSFHVPVLGSSYTMYTDLIRFGFCEDYLDFYITPHEPMVCTLYLGRRHHSEIIQYLRDNPNSAVFLENSDPSIYYVSVHKNIENTEWIIGMLKTLFSCEDVFLEIILYNDYSALGRCSFHLLDLYEMGYMSSTSVVCHHYPFLQQPNTRIYTGILLSARRPFHKYNYDYIEVNMSNHTSSSLKREHLVKLSLDTLLQDRPTLEPHLSSLIANLVGSIPLKNKKRISHNIMNHWKSFHYVRIYTRELAIPLRQWKPSLFLQYLSRLLDMFPSYYIDIRFNLDVAV